MGAARSRSRKKTRGLLVWHIAKESLCPQTPRALRTALVAIGEGWGGDGSGSGLKQEVRTARPVRYGRVRTHRWPAPPHPSRPWLAWACLSVDRIGLVAGLGWVRCLISPAELREQILTAARGAPISNGVPFSRAVSSSYLGDRAGRGSLGVPTGVPTGAPPSEHLILLSRLMGTAGTANEVCAGIRAPPRPAAFRTPILRPS